jgi:hypothetical protein
MMDYISMKIHIASFKLMMILEVCINNKRNKIEILLPLKYN